jgi:hypothetical protein
MIATILISHLDKLWINVNYLKLNRSNNIGQKCRTGNVPSETKGVCIHTS